MKKFIAVNIVVDRNVPLVSHLSPGRGRVGGGKGEGRRGEGQGSGRG